VKVLSWNLGAAYGRWRDDAALHDRAWHWIASLDPDIALLQETRPPEWACDRWIVETRPYQLFASAILARPGLKVTPAVPTAGSTLDGFGSYLATADLELSEQRSILIASVHTSARLAPEWGHPGFDRTAISRATVGEPWWNDVAFAGYRAIALSRQFLIGGDWNTARYVGGDGGQSVEGAEFFNRAESAGWQEVSLDESGREGRSWFGSSNPQPYQPDHVFADRAIAQSISNFEIVAWPVTMLGLSDHAPLLFDLDLDADPTDSPDPHGSSDDP
jgi:endonuclease/exonuclease/phosphatase family metal-dependent hydrolase